MGVVQHSMAIVRMPNAKSQRPGCSCKYCETRAALTIDHVLPLSKGGKWVWENLVTACTKCNGKKGSKSLKQTPPGGLIPCTAEL